MVHPLGQIALELHVREGHLTGMIDLPKDVTGTLHWGGAEQELAAGAQVLNLLAADEQEVMT